MAKKYDQYCPMAHALDMVGDRWELLIVRELLVGSSRFNEIRRGLPTCSTALLSQRLKSLERAGVVEHIDGEGGATYQLTPAGWELFPLIQGLGEWGQRWARSEYQEEELDPGLLLWDVRRYLSPSLATDRVVVLNLGRVIAAGAPAEVQRNPAVVEAYLGAPADGGDGDAAAG